MHISAFIFTAVLLVIPQTIFSQQSISQNHMRDTSEEFVPDWAKSAVWYQIFPERFCNGDKSNDPKLKDISGAWPHDAVSAWQIHPWTSDWYKLQPYEKKNGKDIWFNLQRRRYGGDLQGILDKLDYLQQLGINAIYLNPVFDAPSLHKYDGASYHHIDPNFGPDPEGDRKLMMSETPHDPDTWIWTEADKLMLRLIEEVHKRNMRIIFDGVFNHMGLNSFAFQDLLKNQEKSIYKDWFTVKSFRNPVKGTQFEYEGWFGVKELPELKEDKNGIVTGPREYIFSATRRWMDPEGNGNISRGIDGWRLDVAYCVRHEFWKDWRSLVKSINPGAYLTAEVIDSIKVIKPYLLGDEFDAVMNYNFAFTCAEYFVSEKSRIKTSEFDKKLSELREAFPVGVAFVQQNLFGSHDANRIGSHIVNRDLGVYRNWPEYFGKSRAENPAYDTRKPNDKELRIQKLFVIFQMTYPGAPMVYYGDEAGMWGANDPDCRKPMIWKEMQYEDETTLPDQSVKTHADKVEFNEDLFDHYRKLIGIRNRYAALQLGDYTTILTNDQTGIYAFSRKYEDKEVIVILNNSEMPHRAAISSRTRGVYRDVLNEKTVKTDKGRLALTIRPKWAAILVKE